MLDIKFIKENVNIVKEAAKNKRISVDIDKLLKLHETIRQVTYIVDNLRAERNSLSKQIPNMSKEDRAEAVLKVKALKDNLIEHEAELLLNKEAFDKIMLMIPSVPAPEVPIGNDENDNVEIRRWGDIPKFSDFEAKDHLELAENLGLVDIARATKFAGSRSYFLKGDGLLLEMAICRFVIDKLVSKGFNPMSVPLMVRENAMLGTGYFPFGYEQAYKLQEDGLYLIGTSEVSLISYHQNEILDYQELPKKYAGYSTCFRREAGTYGKDTRGLYRVHQFQKVEQVIVCENDDALAEEFHYQILNNTEEILRDLELPYRVCLACTGEIGLGQVRKHEIEAWMPSRNGYCETHSCSTLNDFQSRRSNIKYRDANGSLKYAYTLNNTGIASPRILIPLLEVHQNADGSVTIPKALRKYMDDRDKIIV